jgi:hypothetical protein
VRQSQRRVKAGESVGLSLAKSLRKVFLYGMNAAIAERRDSEIHVSGAPNIQLLRAGVEMVHGLAVISENRVPHIQTQVRDSIKPQMEQWLDLIPEIEAQARDLTKRQLEQWFDWMDGILAVHRSSCVFREPTPAQLAEHKKGLELAIEYCRFINNLIDDPGFNEPDLVSRLKVRIRQLQDAYDTFHDTTLSDAQAEEVLNQVFPE